MTRRRSIAEEVAQILVDDDDPDQGSLESSAERNESSAEEDLEQLVISTSGSDVTHVISLSSKSESDCENEIDDDIATDTYFKTKEANVK